MIEDELLGVVVLSRREPEPFTDEHIALVQTFADEAAIAITNARLLEAVERQRTEVSRFVSPQVAELVSSRDGEQLLAGHRAYITCLSPKAVTARFSHLCPRFPVASHTASALPDGHARAGSARDDPGPVARIASKPATEHRRLQHF